MTTRKNVLKAFLGLAFLVGVNAFAQKSVQFSGAMLPTKNIVENAVNSKELSILVTAVKAADLVETLSSKGPFTVFAPTNDAFNKLPKETLESLLKPENKEILQAILTYHVIVGKFDSKSIAEAIKIGNGTAIFITAQGGKIRGSFEDKKLVLTDEKESKSYVTIADVNQSNGVIHIVDHVILHK